MKLRERERGQSTVRGGKKGRLVQHDFTVLRLDALEEGLVLQELDEIRGDLLDLQDAALLCVSVCRVEENLLDLVDAQSVARDTGRDARGYADGDVDACAL